MMVSAVLVENCDSTMSMNSRKTMPFTVPTPLGVLCFVEVQKQNVLQVTYVEC